MEMVDVAVKDGNGKLLADAIPVVTISSDGSYSGMDYGADPICTASVKRQIHADSEGDALLSLPE